MALVHDTLCQLGGAERVALLLARTFPGAVLHTALYDPARTYLDFAAVPVRTMPLNRLAPLRHRPRAAVWLLAGAYSRLRPDARVTVCSSSGWAHGARPTGRKVVYCHAPARWLYQTDRYLGGTDTAAGPTARARRRAAALTLGAIGARLRRWDQDAALSADRYLANSTATAAAVRKVYGLEAEVVPPPSTLDVGGPQEAPPGIEPGYWLCVARLLPYKHVDAVIEAVRSRGERLVVAGDGPDGRRLRALAGPGARLLGRVGEKQLRWLYANASGLIVASNEDFGLTPIEIGGFGKPVAALRWGGLLDTVHEGRNGLFFEDPDPAAIAAVLERIAARSWDEEAIRENAARFSIAGFVGRLQAVVAEELRLAG